MSKQVKTPAGDLGDEIALRLQQLRKQGKIDDDQPLLRIEFQREAAEAPFQFDAVSGKIHRNGCKSIPRHARSALYGVWHLPPEAAAYACSRCRPAEQAAETTENDRVSHTLFGVLSVLDQFGSVLVERGRDYRHSERGRQLEKTMRQLVKDLDQKQRETLDGVLHSFDALLNVVNDYNHTLSGNGNGSRAKERSNGRSGKSPAKRPRKKR
jgi:small nuclear ribonucleoprotein (snRNP)-like protein